MAAHLLHRVNPYNRVTDIDPTMGAVSRIAEQISGIAMSMKQF